jgi:hypothetical protein
MTITPSRAFRLPSCYFAVVVLAASAARGVSQQGPVAPKTSANSTLPWHQKTIVFSDEKPILGVPQWNGRTLEHCSGDGTIFVDLYPEASSPNSTDLPQIFRVASDGTAIGVRRKTSLDFTGFSSRDFFVTQHSIVTLLKAIKRDDDADRPSARDIHYFLSTSDYDGGSANLVPLDLRFAPLKIAKFGSGDYIVLGWDEGNLLPLIVLLKEDGTIRRFIDIDDGRHSDLYTNNGPLKGEESSAAAQSNLAVLQRAQFVPYGSQVLLTYPGTARSIRVLSVEGEDRSIPIQMPAGFVLHDVLASGGSHPLVVRVQSVDSSGQSASEGTSATPTQRLFEFDPSHGTLIRELLFNKPHIDEVLCAPASELTSIFLDIIPNAATIATDAEGHPTQMGSARQLVIATASRFP